jgi:hypothetical protein
MEESSILSIVAFPQPPLGFVDNSLEGEIIMDIGDNPQVTDEIFDLGTVIETETADEFISNTGTV